jgi:hypothetical protein
MIKVAPRLSEGGGDDEAVLYVVGTEDPNEATRLIRNAISIGSKIEDVGRVSRQLLASLRIEPDHFKRI